MPLENWQLRTSVMSLGSLSQCLTSFTNAQPQHTSAQFFMSRISIIGICTKLWSLLPLLKSWLRAHQNSQWKTVLFKECFLGSSVFLCVNYPLFFTTWLPYASGLTLCWNFNTPFENQWKTAVLFQVCAVLLLYLVVSNKSICLEISVNIGHQCQSPIKLMDLS